MTWRPEFEGIDHVNAYSRSRIPIGGYLSNFAVTPFVVPEGTFNSIEGYWYWLAVAAMEPRRNELRYAAGSFAKRLGQHLRAAPPIHVPDFDARICEAFDAKLEMNPHIRREWALYGHLPVVHYYVSPSGAAIVPVKHLWLWEHVNALRVRLFPEQCGTLRTEVP